jgi:hypothetical protein
MILIDQRVEIMWRKKILEYASITNKKNPKIVYNNRDKYIQNNNKIKEWIKIKIKVSLLYH